MTNDINVQIVQTDNINVTFPGSLVLGGSSGPGSISTATNFGTGTPILGVSGDAITGKSLATSSTITFSATSTEITPSVVQSALNTSEFNNDAGFTSYDSANFDTDFSGKNTSVLTEGTNLYYTEARVSANTDVSANTTSRHDALTVTDSTEIDFTLTGQDLTASLKATGVTAGIYTASNISVDSKGRILFATSTTGITMNSDTDVSGNGWVLDEDDFASNSDTKVPTQQSVKAYVDANSGGGSNRLLISHFIFTTQDEVSTTGGASLMEDATSGIILRSSGGSIRVNVKMLYCRTVPNTTNFFSSNPKATFVYRIPNKSADFNGSFGFYLDQSFNFSYSTNTAHIGVKIEGDGAGTYTPYIVFGDGTNNLVKAITNAALQLTGNTAGEASSSIILEIELDSATKTVSVYVNGVFVDSLSNSNFDLTSSTSTNWPMRINVNRIGGTAILDIQPIKLFLELDKTLGYNY